MFYKNLSNIPKRVKLTKDQQREVIVKAQAGDTDSINILINNNYKLILKIANRFAHPSLELEDLVQEGILSIHDTLSKYDVNRGIKFTTYYHYDIVSRISEYYRRNSGAVRLPNYLLNDSKKVKKFKFSYWKQYGKLPDSKDICSGLKFTPQKLRRIYSINAENISLDAKIEEENDESTLLDHIKVPEVNNNYENIFGRLSNDEYEMLEMYSGIYNGGVRCSYKKLGERYGMNFRETRKKINQIKRKVRKEMRKCTKDH
jgi:RNA polymerase primary sigma factor